MISYNKYKISSGLIIALGLFLVLGFYSCDSDQEENDITPGESASDKHARILESIPHVLKMLPEIRIAHENASGGKEGNPDKNDGFDFGDPGDFNFSNPSGNTYTSEQGVVIVTTPGFGSNTGGGTISAGSQSFDITATFCLSAGEEGDGAELASAFTGGIDGVSLVIGIAGDLGSASTDTTQLFGGLEALALYVVFDDEAQGNYDVINFFDIETDSAGSIGDLEGSAYAYIIDLKDGNLFISSDGSLNVSGGNISFEGEYLQLDFDTESGFGEISEPEDFKIVQGAGAMGC